MPLRRDRIERIGPSAPPDEGGGGTSAATGADDGTRIGTLTGIEPGDFAITRDGVWWHDGAPIPRRELVKLFATVLKREADGGYALVTPAERARVHVEDVPFLAEELEVTHADGQQVLTFRTNTDRWIEAGPDHPIWVEHVPDSAEPAPYIRVSDGLDARLVRSVFYQLAELAESRPTEGRMNANDASDSQGQEVLGVWSRGTFFRLTADAPA
ncbi:DUF1285 domain-containing protein [Rhodovibrio salinarum]|uniref:DUF1285 domain-containing protein n=1 Tax=Rhodovibrio salinarum TaxID=1087 RepID=A0A934QGT4_9PROT|nr:DUF1285 domain-containing protein [Rhodovibrio salinarum]MBK1696255.1 DUF1285 domain-containing protein [Rhodovibrio salinarum]